MATPIGRKRRGPQKQDNLCPRPGQRSSHESPERTRSENCVPHDPNVCPRMPRRYGRSGLGQHLRRDG